MKQLSSAQVRQMWLDFWASKGHSVEPSVSLVPVNDQMCIRDRILDTGDFPWGECCRLPFAFYLR